ncbi:MAG: hypothetical protein ACI3XR_02785 [Eubacteriales bacterium]
MNGYDSLDYQKRRRILIEKLYREQNRSGEMPCRTVRLVDGFSVLSECFECEHEGYRVHGSRNILTDCNGHPLFTWHNTDTAGEFFYLFHHSDGSRYLLYREDLYGYGILNPDTTESHHEIPLSSVQKGDGFRETFIWTDPRYDPKNSLLAVSGCLWAAPYSVILLDFTDPMAEHPSEKWVDLHDILDLGYQKYSGIDLHGFDHEGNLLLDAEPADSDGTVRLCIPAEECLRIVGCV